MKFQSLTDNKKNPMQRKQRFQPRRDPYYSFDDTIITTAVIALLFVSSLFISKNNDPIEFSFATATVVSNIITESISFEGPISNLTTILSDTTNKKRRRRKGLEVGSTLESYTTNRNVFNRNAISSDSTKHATASKQQLQRQQQVPQKAEVRFPPRLPLLPRKPAPIPQPPKGGSTTASKPKTKPISQPKPKPIPRPVPKSKPVIKPVPKPVPKPATSSSTSSTNAYKILLDMPTLSAADKAIFQTAASKWMSIITKDLPDVETKIFSSPPPAEGKCKYPNIIDDLYICGYYKKIDGASKVLGMASPTYTREFLDGTDLVITGEMMFDTDDITELKKRGQLQSVILHEMGHVLGIGTLSKYWGDGEPKGNCPTYSGTNANREYKSITGCARVPIENDGSAGSKCGHFDEQCLISELMTPSIMQGEPKQPLSRVTVGALNDLGYTVDYSKADSYTATMVNKTCLCKKSFRRTNLRNLKADDDAESQAQLENIQSPTKGDDNVKISTFNPGIHRKLSNELYRTALDFGKKYLQQQRDEYKKSMFVRRDTPRDTNVRFVGGDVVSVFMLDEDYHIHEVIVRNT